MLKTEIILGENVYVYMCICIVTWACKEEWNKIGRKNKFKPMSKCRLQSKYLDMKFSMTQKVLQHKFNKNKLHNNVILVIIRYFGQHSEESEPTYDMITQKRSKCH